MHRGLGRRRERKEEGGMEDGKALGDAGNDVSIGLRDGREEEVRRHGRMK